MYLFFTGLIQNSIRSTKRQNRSTYTTIVVWETTLTLQFQPEHSFQLWRDPISRQTEYIC